MAPALTTPASGAGVVAGVAGVGAVVVLAVAAVGAEVRAAVGSGFAIVGAAVGSGYGAEDGIGTGIGVGIEVGDISTVVVVTCAIVMLPVASADVLPEGSASTIVVTKSVEEVLASVEVYESAVVRASPSFDVIVMMNPRSTEELSSRRRRVTSVHVRLEMADESTDSVEASALATADFSSSP